METFTLAPTMATYTPSILRAKLTGSIPAEGGLIPPRSRNSSASVEECVEQFDANFRPRDETLNDAELLPESLPETLFLALDVSVLQNCFDPELSIFLAGAG